MTDRLYIDDLDAFTAYGVFVHDGGYSNLVQWPSIKSIDSNDWPEDDGIDADLSDPKLESKDFQMSFCCVDYEKTILLFQLLTDGAYHTFNFAEIGAEKELRLVSQPNTQTIAPLQVFSLQFADDNYMKGYVREEPIEIPSCWQRGFEIDGRDLSSYGVWVISGTLDQLLKAPSVKKNLTVDASIITGVIHEDTEVKFQSKDAALKCLLKAPSSAIFWRNYKVLLHDLIQSAERGLYIANSNEYFSCYYKNSKVSNFAKNADGSIWCEFDITLCFVSARPGQVEYFLSSEDDYLIITEDSDELYNCFIDMSYEN